MPEQYKKPALTFEQQLSHLQNRGLVINDQADALLKLSAISYYRLSGYWFPFRLRDKNGQPENHFIAGTGFDQVLELYEFDRHLRALVMDAIERVEVAVRTRITYHMGHTYGAFGHTVAANFHPKFDHFNWLKKLEMEASRSSDQFVRHYKERYNGFPTLPVWMLTEVMSFGALSFFYKGLKNPDKRAVAAYFNLHPKRLGDWLHTLTYVRNVCAHHSRLWNRELAIRPDKAKEPEWQPPVTPRNDRPFYILLMLRYLLRQSGNGDEWAVQIDRLLTPITQTNTYRLAMGIPEDWKDHPLWK
ncbi:MULTISPECIES: Abi family protein [Gammaproteobacteria]|uniref:Abi family protein n=1 Tax=Gammaproteobacteria TaxID=1236 RepID=UPI00079C7309|nr:MULTISPECIES: Abi family protein [Gammaproteobacteria]KXJ47346.1 MAG: ABC transporter permease [Marinobacter sp. Hex_13]MEE3387360.1 Abi family protein [Pseudomonadota bacterium]SEF83139.1 Abortive infection bacteriophage resistance protein [Alcanivorax sp. DSM 26293]